MQNVTDLAQVLSGQMCAGGQDFDHNILHAPFDGLEDLQEQLKSLKGRASMTRRDEQQWQ